MKAKFSSIHQAGRSVSFQFAISQIISISYQADFKTSCQQADFQTSRKLNIFKLLNSWHILQIPTRRFLFNSSWRADVSTSRNGHISNFSPLGNFMMMSMVMKMMTMMMMMMKMRAMMMALEDPVILPVKNGGKLEILVLVQFFPSFLHIVLVKDNILGKFSVQPIISDLKLTFSLLSEDLNLQLLGNKQCSHIQHNMFVPSSSFPSQSYTENLTYFVRKTFCLLRLIFDYIFH